MGAILIGILAIFFVSSILLYAYAKYHNGYWRRRGIPGPNPKPFSGNLDEWFPNKPAVFQLREWTQKYGKVYGMQEGWRNTLVTSDPQLLNELFTKKFEYFHGRKTSPTSGNVDKMPRVNIFSARGARWKRLRSIANPIFSVSNLKKIMPILHDSSHVMMEYFEKARIKGERIDVNRHFHELSMDIIMRAAMGQHGSRQFENVEQVEALSKLFDTFGRTQLHYIGLITEKVFGNILHYIMVTYARIKNSPFITMKKFIDTEIRKRIEQRNFKHQNENLNKSEIVDFIDLFLESECQELQVTKELTVNEISSMCLLFLLAGFDTTANSLSAICHYLARNLASQTRLFEEIIAICGESGDPTYEQLNQLRYGDAVIKEALRLCPIGAAVCARECSKTTTLGKYTIEEGTIIQADVFSLQLDKSIWGEDAKEFRPERWLEKETQSRTNLGWMAFGAGPRICIGMRLAYLVEKLALVNFLRVYKMRTTPNSEIEMKLSGNVALKPERVEIALEKIE